MEKEKIRKSRKETIRMKIRNYRAALPETAAALFMLAAFHTASLSPANESGKLFGINFNLISYVLIAISAFIVYGVIHGLQVLLLPKLMKNSGSGGGRAGLVFPVLLFVPAVMYYYWKMYGDELNIYPGEVMESYFRHRLPHPVYFALCLCLFLLFLLAACRAEKTRKKLRFTFAVLAGAADAVLLYAPNIFQDRGAGVYHIHAYTNSIINAAALLPYDEIRSGIYGHYGIFFIPCARLFGGMTGIFIGISLAGALTVLALSYTAHLSIRNDLVYLLTVFAILGTTLILMRRGQYYQLNPHRLLFPALTSAFLSRLLYRSPAPAGKAARVLGLVLCILAVVWNLETGLFCALTVSAFFFYQTIREHGLFSFRTLTESAILLLSPLLSFFGAFALVGCFNLSAGGAFGSVREFIYPLMSGNLTVSGLRIALPPATAVYVFEVILFLTAVFTSFFMAGRRTDRKMAGTEDAAPAVRFHTGMMGALMIIYFLNRAAYGNMAIAHAQFVLLLGICGDEGVSAVRSFEAGLRTGERSGDAFTMTKGSLLLLALVILCVESAACIPQALSFRENGSWNTAPLKAAMTDMEQTLPENTPGYGIGIPELYRMMGRDTGLHLIDISDMNDASRQYLNQFLKDQDDVLTSVTPAQSDTSLPSGFTVVRSWQIDTTTILYLKRE